MLNAAVKLEPRMSEPAGDLLARSGFIEQLPSGLPRAQGTPDWIVISDLHDDSPGVSGAARRKWVGRRWKQIRRDTEGCGARREWRGALAQLVVTAGAVWNPQTGQTAGELYAARRPAATLPMPSAKPPGWDQADDATKQRHQVAVWARQQWLSLRREFSGDTDPRRHQRWVSECGARCKAASIGTSLSSVYRLCDWNPEKSLCADGRRQRGGEPVVAGTEQFWGELLYFALKVNRGTKGTFKAAYRMAAGRALARGETPPKEGPARKWYNEKVPPSYRGIFHDPRQWERAHGESVRRDYSQFRPMQLWSGDWHRCDFRVWYRGKWMACSPKPDPGVMRVHCPAAA